MHIMQEFKEKSTVQIMSVNVKETETKASNVESNNAKKDQRTPTTEVKDYWMTRPCIAYDEEYSECTSIRARLHQYFVFGETIDCNQWKRDSVNCYKWMEENDVLAGEELVKSEKQRRRQRLLPHYQNDIWKRRKEPPQDWNKPLPKSMQEAYETTYLNIKSKEIKGEIPETFDMKVPSLKCTIL